MDLASLPDFTLPLLCAVIAGGLIGFEREWRGRAAGFRTHILVCLASALLMEMAVSQGAWRFDAIPGTEIVSDPTRMAHGVLTGIGFLCAGVIFRAGFSIHGLTTAASLWITAAIGLLFGAGLFGLAATGTVLTVVVLLILRLVSLRLPQKAVIDAEVVWRRGAVAAEEAVEAALSDIDRDRRSDRFELIDHGESVRRTFRLKIGGDGALKTLAARLRAIEGVTGYRLDPRDD
ncbi:putative Mg2+ transporter-C (MgtC) family protein [Brevundimonas alba]|uniref:Protein MgtC n=1 Tax=Brevundimonas alba TaxID=74314 RepID=A0A7X5YK77_9CAUL|nr:MgtC/SapB family protein [Brevundimonas alba]NJC40209.1 putative Mg2+ transporter-C (MgtC) family protein [Brevundimonas alba]